MAEENGHQEIDIKTSSQPTAVYIPFKTLQTAITSFVQALPTKLDRSAWPSFSGLVQGQTFNAFKFLGLIDKDGNVQPVLKELANEKLESPKVKSILADILKAKYDKVVALASQHGTIAQLQETMRGYNVSGTTLDRAIRFWTEAAKFSGIQYPANWKKARTSSGSGGRKRKGTQAGVSPEGTQGEHPQTNKVINNGSSRGYVKKVTLQGDIGTVTLAVSVNPLELIGRNRTWFYELVDKLNECLGKEKEDEQK